MFSDFFATVQDDADNIYRAISYGIPFNERATFGAEVGRAVARAFGLLGMAFGAFLGLRGCFSIRAAPISGLITMAFGVAVLALGHDVFVIFKKFSDWELFKEPFPPHLLSSAKDTFYRPLWQDGMHRLFGWT